MIFEAPQADPATFAAVTGWELKPEGACKGERCVPLRGAWDGGLVELAAVADRLGMPLVADPAHGLWAVGPQAGGRTLEDATFPALTLPDVDGNRVDLEVLRGRRFLLLAWASW